ncbi:MAG: hypothetical protein M3N28_01775 [Actinomycetota bacterium]|nr:hypothetical protein [Actinomycetota bacterium]
MADVDVVLAFIEGQPAGHSERFHLEGAVLVAGFDLAMGMRIGVDTILVRVDVPADAEDHKAIIKEVLAEQGMTLLDEETVLATPVAVQWLALRASTWDLWGRDIDESFAALRTAAVGDPFGSPIGE